MRLLATLGLSLEYLIIPFAAKDLAEYKEIARPVQNSFSPGVMSWDRQGYVRMIVRMNFVSVVNLAAMMKWDHLMR